MTSSSGTAPLARRALRVVGWPARAVVLALVRLYRVTLSGVLGGQCRFHPTCSVYAEEAVRNRGAIVGSALAAWRIVRCTPLCRGGVDPAPGPFGAAVMAAYDNVIPRQGAQA